MQHEGSQQIASEHRHLSRPDDHHAQEDAGQHAVEAGAPVERARMERVFFNLCSNSLEALLEGGSIRISAAQQNGAAVIRFEDDGPGIPVELHDKVFERFFRGAGDRSGSSGLGLAIVRAVAESHHGTVTLEDPLGAFASLSIWPETNR